MWLEMKQIPGHHAGEAGSAIATLRAHNGNVASISKGKRQVLEKHFPASWQHPGKTNCSTQFSKRKSTRGYIGTEVRQIGTTVVQGGYRDSSGEED